MTVMVKHPDYYTTETATRQITYAGPKENGALPVPTAARPTIFLLRKKGATERLIHPQTSKFHLPMDGTVVNVDLRNGKFESGNDSIAIALHSDGGKPPIHTYYSYDWTLRIQVPGGGVQERPDLFQFQAPLAGYQDEISFSKAASMPREDWKDHIDDEFFVLLPSKNYARVKIHMVALKGGCQIESFLNPDPNSRNLEFDSNHPEGRSPK